MQLKTARKRVSNAWGPHLNECGQRNDAIRVGGGSGGKNPP